MNHSRSLGIALLGAAATLLIPAMAQGQDKKPAKKPVRVMLLASGGVRTPPTQKELQQRFETKLEGEWLKNAAWNLDYDEARAKAKASGKQIFAYFTRSYSP